MLIGELSERTGVSSRLLRYYEEQGLLDATRSPNGYRVYTPEAVRTVRRELTALDSRIDELQRDRGALCEQVVGR